MDTHIVWKRYLPLNIQRIFQHTPAKKNQTLNQHFMKELLSFLVLGMAGVCSGGYVGVLLEIQQKTMWVIYK